MSIEAIGADVLVIGGGLAGAFAAIKAREAGAEAVALVTKGKLGKDSVSAFAAGVYEVVFPEDDRDAELRKRALSESFGAGLYDEEWLNIYLDENYDRLLEMDKWGVKWEKTPTGKFERKECRWKTQQCMFQGPQLMEAMAKKVIGNRVRVIGHTMVTDLLTQRREQEERVVGAIGFDIRSGELKAFKAKSTVLAAGGCGFKQRVACYKFQTGEAIAMAYRAGATLGRFEVGDILSMTATDFSIQGKNMFVGLGGTFVNARGDRFMLEYEPELGDHAGQAYISASMAMEIRAGRGPIYLDLTRFTPEEVKKLRTVLPIPARIMERAGVMVGDRIIKKIEWAPSILGTVAMGGGVIINTKCETSLPGLYACGDAAARGPSRPSALGGAAVSGARAGRFAAENAKEADEPSIDEQQVNRLKKYAFAPLEKRDGIDPEHIIMEIQELLTPYGVTVILREDRLDEAIREVERIRDEEIPLLYALDIHYLRLANEAKSMALAAEMLLRSYRLRKESRNGCLREDYPYTDNMNWLKWTLLKQENGKMKLWTEDVPVESYKVKPERNKYLHPIFDVASKRGVKWG